MFYAVLVVIYERLFLGAFLDNLKLIWIIFEDTFEDILAQGTKHLNRKIRNLGMRNQIFSSRKTKTKKNTSKLL